MRRYALAGAEARLIQITQEAESIRRAFPELVGNGAGRNAGQGAVQSAGAGNEGRGRRTPRKRPAMSAAQRRAVGERMKKYWAARKGGLEAERSEAANASSSKGKKRGRRGGQAAKSSAKRGPRTMSPAARKRISEAQKARWAKQRQATTK